MIPKHTKKNYFNSFCEASLALMPKFDKDAMRKENDKGFRPEHKCKCSLKKLVNRFHKKANIA